MPIDPGPHDIENVAFILGPDGKGTHKRKGPTFYEELDTDFNGFRGHVLVQRFTFSEAWPTWEMHPHGDEMVYLLAGDTQFVLWRDGREELVRVNQPGSYVTVPRGVWHTARPLAATTLLFITPGEGTLNAESPPDDYAVGST